MLLDIGIFYYSASFDDSPSHYISKNAKEVLTTPVNAIVRAHLLEQESHTEYGVHVDPEVLKEAKRELIGLK